MVYILTLHNRQVNLSLPVLDADSSSRIRAFSASTTWPLLLNCAQYLSTSILGFTVPSSCVFSFLIDTSSGPTFSHESIASIAFGSFSLHTTPTIALLYLLLWYYYFTIITVTLYCIIIETRRHKRVILYVLRIIIIVQHNNYVE